MAKQKNKMEGFGERNLFFDTGNKQSYPAFEAIGRALSAAARIEILDLLKLRAMSIGEIAEALNLPVSSTAYHINILEEANLVITENQPAIRGSMRLCQLSVNTVTINTAPAAAAAEPHSIIESMPIGEYFDCDITPTCGLCDENGMIGVFDSAKSFYSPLRSRAQLLWFQQGYVEYRFPNHTPRYIDPYNLSFSLELSSEAPGYQDKWPSDITISVNGCRIATYTSPGDFGARRGKLTPASWPYGSTQYGMLKTFSIREKGSYIDEVLVPDSPSISELELRGKPYISFRVEIREDAKFKGGINLFGEKFGDYPQDIVMRMDY